MNIQQLEYALLLRKTGSFSAAAKKVHITQSAISQQITKLEQELGFVLFDRQSKPIVLTANGEKFLERAQNVLLEVHQLRDFAMQIEEEVKGALTIGIIPTLSPYLTPLFINNLSKKYPDIKLTIKELMTKDIVRGIMERELNGGIISTPISTTLKFQYQSLFYEKFYILLSPEHHLYKQDTIDLSQIDLDQLWLLNEGNCFSDQVNNMCQLDRSKRIETTLSYESNSIDALRRIVENRGGITFLPELATLNVPAEQEEMIKEIKGPPRAREISLIYVKGEPKINLLDRLAETIRLSLPAPILNKGDKVLVKTNIKI
ncbi:MAG: hydrogen peroxide-inducible genes activator [Saprospiraceae bacterium]